MATMANVVGLFNSPSQAKSAVDEVIHAGAHQEDIRIVVDDAQDKHDESSDEIAVVDSSATIGAADEFFGGGLLGTLVATGLPDAQAHAYAEGVHRGGTVVLVKADDTTAASIRDTLNRNGAVDIDAQANEWRSDGWNGFYSNAGPYFGEQQEGDPIPEPDADLSPADGSPAASVGALSGGMVPGTYGAAGETIFGNDDAARRPNYERD